METRTPATVTRLSGFLTIRSVEEVEKGFYLSGERKNSDCICNFFLPKKHLQGLIPQKGDIVVLFFTKWSIIIGVSVNRKMIYRLSQEELDEDLEEERQAEADELEKRFPNLKSKLDEWFATVPEIVKHRISMFRREIKNFRRDDEHYELSTWLLVWEMYQHPDESLDEILARLENNGYSGNQCTFAEVLVDVLKNDLEKQISVENLEESQVMHANSIMFMLTGNFCPNRAECIAREKKYYQETGKYAE